MESLSSVEWIDFLNAIGLAKKQLGNSDTIWYRGQNNVNYPLLPTLLRYKNGIEKEKLLFERFCKFSERISQRRECEWETLFEMQHYGIPTRLLDWSETFCIALFFAVYSHTEQDAAIYLLNPKKLNEQNYDGKILKLPKVDNFKYSALYIDRDLPRPTSPVAVEPIFSNSRMFAQRGMFTIHHDKTDPIEKKFPKAVKKVVLSNKLFPTIKEFLELSNINELTVFPDFAGMAGYLKHSTGLIMRP